MHHSGQQSLFLLREKKWHHKLSDPQNGWTLQTQKTQFVIWHHQLWFSIMLQSVWKIVSLITQPPVECKICSLSRAKISLFYSGFVATLIKIISFYIFITDGRVFRCIRSKNVSNKDVGFLAATHFNTTRRRQSSHQAWIKHGLFAYTSQKGKMAVSSPYCISVNLVDGLHLA